MSQNVSQNSEVFVPEKCHLSQKTCKKIPEWAQKNMACMEDCAIRRTTGNNSQTSVFLVIHN